MRCWINTENRWLIGTQGPEDTGCVPGFRPFWSLRRPNDDGGIGRKGESAGHPSPSLVYSGRPLAEGMRLDAQTAVDWIREQKDRIAKLEPLKGQKRGELWERKFNLLADEIERFFHAIRTKRLELLGEEIDYASLPVPRIEIVGPGESGTE